MNQTSFTNGFYEKSILRGKWAILGLKMVYALNFGSAVRIFLNFCTMIGAKKYMKIILMAFLKKLANLSLKMAQPQNFRSALRNF